jgi:hypothetical protein
MRNLQHTRRGQEIYRYKQKLMITKLEQVEKWNNLRVQGDVKKIATIYDISPKTLYRALKTGRMNVKTLEAFSLYFKDRINNLS